MAKKIEKKVKRAENRDEKISPKFVKKFLSFELRPSERVKYANFFVPPRKSFSKVSIVKNTKYFRNFRVLKIFGDFGHLTIFPVFPILSSFIKSDQTENRSTHEKVMGQNLKRFLFSGNFKM